MPKARAVRGKRPPASIRKDNQRRRGSGMGGRRLGSVLVLGAVTLGFLMGYVWVSHAAVQTGYELARLKKEQTRLVENNRRLKVELANLSALKRIEFVAKNQLGLTEPRPQQVIVVK